MLEHVRVHQSQFPKNILSVFRASFENRSIQPKFHYQSPQQSAQWLKIHRAYSPACQGAGYIDIYRQCFAATIAGLAGSGFDLISLGCGGGGKEALLLSMLQESAQNKIEQVRHYYPVDVSLPMTLHASEAARSVSSECAISPIVCDVLQAEDLLEHIGSDDLPRVITLFGVLPNCEPEALLPLVRGYMNEGDHLLLGTNLAPGGNYAAGVSSIVGQYDNALTRKWLMQVLLDVGVEANDGRLDFGIEYKEGELPLARVKSKFIVEREVEIEIDELPIVWKSGEMVDVFFSYRYSKTLLAQMLQRYNIEIVDAWCSAAGEEGLFLCRKSRV